MNPRETYLRNRELTLDFLTGVSYSELAEKYNISTVRCGQIIRRTIYSKDRKLYWLCNKNGENQKDGVPYSFISKEFIKMKDHLIPKIHNETKNWIVK